MKTSSAYLERVVFSITFSFPNVLAFELRKFSRFGEQPFALSSDFKQKVRFPLIPYLVDKIFMSFSRIWEFNYLISLYIHVPTATISVKGIPLFICLYCNKCTFQQDLLFAKLDVTIFN